MNNNRQKKIAPRAATPETKNTKNVSINSILLNNPKIKCVLQRTDEMFSRPVRLGDVPQTFISGKIICEDLNGTDYCAVKLDTKETMTIGYISRKSSVLSELAEKYVAELAKYKENVLS